MEPLPASERMPSAMSRPNPDRRHADWGLDTYAEAVLDALDAVEAITGSERTHLLGLCAGGIVLSPLLSHLAATRPPDRIPRLAPAGCGVANPETRPARAV